MSQSPRSKKVYNVRKKVIYPIIETASMGGDSMRIGPQTTTNLNGHINLEYNSQNLNLDKDGNRNKLPEIINKRGSSLLIGALGRVNTSKLQERAGEDVLNNRPPSGL